MDDKDDYVEALCQELEQRQHFFDTRELGTVYFGGGTPSLLSLTQLKTIFKSIHQYFDINKETEITLESNPDDLSEEYLLGLRQIGINRLSIGTQSFDDADLKRINRRHNAAEAINAVKTAQKVGFDNISVDLIFALPHQDMTLWRSNMQQVFDLDIQHISCYNLSYEEGTDFYNKLQQGIYKEASDSLSLSMYQSLIKEATDHNFEHYETSNFAKKGLFSKHNSNYWTGAKYLGVGAGAHSYNGTNRQWNISDNKTYIQGILLNEASREEEKLSQTEAYNEYIMTGLRTMWGCNLNILNEKFGHEMLNFCLKLAEPHIENGHLINKENILYIVPEAIFISDTIMSDLMKVEQE